MKILIADDSPTIVEVMRFLLESQGHEVVSASDGIEAISQTYLTSPDLVLLDIEMPKMTGYQVCRLLKSDEATRNIPIIILTSRGQKKDRFWGLSTGADDFITKDFESEDDLFLKIESVVQRSRTEKAADAKQPPALRAFAGIRPPITEISVLEQVNHILDQQLFHNPDHIDIAIEMIRLEERESVRLALGRPQMRKMDARPETLGHADKIITCRNA